MSFYWVTPQEPGRTGTADFRPGGRQTNGTRRYVRTRVRMGWTDPARTGVRGKGLGVEYSPNRVFKIN